MKGGGATGQMVEQGERGDGGEREREQQLLLLREEKRRKAGSDFRVLNLLLYIYVS